MSICHWPEAERPREKLLPHGATGLSDVERLAISLRTGVSGKTAVDLARFGSPRALPAAEQAAYCEAPGLDQAKFAQLQVVLEIARRYLGESLARGRALPRRRIPGVICGRCCEIAALRHYCLYLDTRHRVLAFEELFSRRLGLLARGSQKGSGPQRRSRDTVAHSSQWRAQWRGRSPDAASARATGPRRYGLLDHLVAGAVILPRLPSAG